MRTAESESVRLNAAEAILNRGWGRPIQALQVDGRFLTKKLTDLTTGSLSHSPPGGGAELLMPVLGKQWPLQTTTKNQCRLSRRQARTQFNRHRWLSIKSRTFGGVRKVHNAGDLERPLRSNFNAQARHSNHTHRRTRALYARYASPNLRSR
jgi:hypothetical protein